MSLFEGKTPQERNKMIAAIALPVIAVIAVLWSVFGSSSSTKTSNTNNRKRTTTQSVTPSGVNQSPKPDDKGDQIVTPPRPLDVDWSLPEVASAERNIFAFYVKPPPTPKLSAVVATPTPTPTPTPPPPPPFALYGINPANVYAQTGDFKLEVTGDKFTADARIYVDNRELPTQIAGAQRAVATVPASLTAASGARQIVVRTPDSRLYSNAATLNIAEPPKPQYTYVGLVGGAKRGKDKDTALLKPQGQNDELLSVHLGEPVGDRFRVTAISENSVTLTDTQLNIKHTLPFTETKNVESPQPFTRGGYRTREVAPGAIQPVGDDQ